MKIIFLDIDGVLNNWPYTIQYNNERRKLGLEVPNDNLYSLPLCEHSLDVLKQIVTLLDAYIVLTSTWRLHEKGMSVITKVFNKLGIGDRFIGCTGSLGNREKEILDWINTYQGQIDSFVIIDDDQIGGLLETYRVKTEMFGEGLSNNHIEKVKKILKAKIY
jgi:hypothetical protein